MGRRSFAPRTGCAPSIRAGAPADLARLAIARAGKHVAGAGAVSALPATIPGAGTVVEVGAALGDASLLTVAQTELVLLLAHLYGRPVTDIKARRLDVLMAMGVEAGVVDLRRNGVVRVMGTDHRDGELSGVAGVALSTRISRRLAAQVAGKLARRRAYVLLGREVPVIGIGLAAGYNLWSTRKLGKAARAHTSTGRRVSGRAIPRTWTKANVWARWRSRWSTRPPLGSPESETFPSTVW